jgi:chemotaxis signal transduction protein
MDHVRGVERAERLSARPEGEVPGSLHSRGATWTIYNPSRWFGERAQTLGKQIVLLESPHGRFGILVDRVSALGQVSNEQLGPAPHGLNSRWVSGVYHTSEGPLPVADVPQLNAPSALATLVAATPTRSRAVAAERWLAVGARTVLGDAARALFLALPVPLVVEVIDAPPPQVVPGSPAHVLGMLEWRGQPLALLDPGVWVGLEPLPTSPRVVVVRGGRTTYGIAAGTTVKVLPTTTLGLPSRRAAFGHTANTLKVLDTTESTIILPDWSRLLSGD